MRRARHAALRGNVETTLAGDIGQIREGLGDATPVETLRAGLTEETSRSLSRN